MAHRVFKRENYKDVQSCWKSKKYQLFEQQELVVLLICG